MRRNDIIQLWNDKDILPGEQWEDELLERLTTADIVIFLVSPSLLNSDYIHRVEIKGAMERHKKGELVIIPILIRNSDFAESDFKTFQGLPSDLKPVSTWEDRDNAWLNVAKGLKRVIQSVQKKIEEKETATSTQNTTITPLSNKNHISGDGIAVQNLNSEGDINITINQNSPTPPQNLSNTPVDTVAILKEAQSLIASGKTKKALESLSEYTQSQNLDDEYNELILQSSKLSNIKKEELQGIRNSSEIRVEMARINKALLSIISDLKEEAK